MDSTRDPKPDEVLEFVLGRLSEQKQQIEPHFRRSETFRSLCNDYMLCGIAIKKWQSDDTSVAALRAREYAECFAELELEIRDWLENEQTASHGVPQPD